MNKVKLILVTVLIAVIASLATYHNQTKKRILVIHSYYTDFAWVTQVNGGIKQFIAANNRSADAVVRYHYMNLLNHPSCEYYRSAANDARLVIQNWKPQIIIIVDDLGQSLVGVNYLDFKSNADTEMLYDEFAAINAKAGCASDPEKDKDYFGLGNIALPSQPKIIFAGVNGNVEKYGYNEANNVTGIFENKNPEAIRQTIADIYNAIPENRKPTSIQVLSDNSGTANSEKAFFEEILPSEEIGVPLVWQPVAYADTLEQWNQNVEAANQNGSMLLIANYRGIKDENGDAVNSKTLITTTEGNARYPVLGAATSFIVDGGMLTMAVPGYEQGQVAIEMAFELLDGTPISLIPPVRASQFIIGMKKSLVILRGLDLPLIYEAFSRQSENFKE